MEKIKRYGNIIIFTCIILELLIWPSINNFFGCLMTIISWLVFSWIGLNEQVIREHIFAWLVFLSMSLFRILPLIATLIEGHSIGYNFVVPLSTYCGETLLYLFSAMAFYLAINCKKPMQLLKRTLFHCNFYAQVNNITLWFLGTFGLICKVYVTINHIEYGDVIGKTIVGFAFFQYAPLLIFFPRLIGNKNSNKIVVLNKYSVLYSILLVILSFATNSREAMLEPIGTFVLLLFLSYINSSKDLRRSINKGYIIIGILTILVVIPILSDVSLAMLYNRQFRKNTNRTELLIKTFNTFRDQNKMEELRSLKEKEDIKAIKTEKKLFWSEIYVSNFALNRYCNLKVTDNTLYHAKKVGFPNKYMFDDFWNEIVALLPTPILNYFNIEYDKNVRYSRGDKLKALSSNRHPLASYLVTSHLADGLVTFGYWYFPIEFLLFFIRFLFLDTFLLRLKGDIYYSIFGLITIFTFLAMFRHAGGCCDSLNYLIRGYWQNVILFLIGFTLFKRLSLKL